MTIYNITPDSAMELERSLSTEELLKLAREVTLERAARHDQMPKAATDSEARNSALAPLYFDTCSIINAKSGRCPEDCHWCAQSAHYHTSTPVYPLLPLETLVEGARQSERRGIGRYSFVTSGKSLSDADIERVCQAARVIRSECPQLSLCASAGLLTEAQFCRLREAGITRYHCNLESSSEHFSCLCSTHTREDKVRTLETARRAGLEICSGGIIGMGESMQERIELAFTLKDLGVKSIPINILHPIPGTPLGEQPLLPEDEILRTVALFRLILPDAYLRLAGGAERLSPETLGRLYSCAINAAIMGDMLTTPGTRLEDNFSLIRLSGYDL